MAYLSYEWVIEALDLPDTDDDAKIIDVDHADTYREALSRAEQHEHARIGLVRDTDETRAWAYVYLGQLPATLQDAFGRDVAKVPVRYREQFDRA